MATEQQKTIRKQSWKLSKLSLKNISVEEATEYIREGWQAGIVILIFTVILALVTQTPSTIVDVVLVIGLTYGIYKKSRVAAGIFLFYFIASKFYIFATYPEYLSAFSIIFAVIIIKYLYQAFLGTLKLKSAANSPIPNTPQPPANPPTEKPLE